MSNTRKYGHRGKGTRPFMPIHGKKPARPNLDDKVMQVGADAMIGDPKTENQTAAGSKPETAFQQALNLDALKQLDAVKAERDSYLDLARRERADFDNYRKRVERDMQAMKRESLASFLKEFFSPLDDMDRVLLECQKNHSFDSLAAGVRIMEENFWRVLAKAGVRKIDAKGKPFDPNLHEAMTAIPSADVPPNTVLEVFDNGYKLDDHVLRPARVVVSRPPDTEN